MRPSSCMLSNESKNPFPGSIIIVVVVIIIIIILIVIIISMVMS